MDRAALCLRSCIFVVERRTFPCSLFGSGLLPGFLLESEYIGDMFLQSVFRIYQECTASFPKRQTSSWISFHASVYTAQTPRQPGGAVRERHLCIYHVSQ
jgi:hypothetical protein